MSAVVHQSVGEQAVAGKRDERIRKPFQPQELIGRVKSLLQPKSATPAPAADRSESSSALSNFFSPPPVPVAPRQVAPPPPATTESAWPRALAEAFVPRQPSQPQHEHQQSNSPPFRPAPTSADVQKLPLVSARLVFLRRTLQTELQIDRQDNQALE